MQKKSPKLRTITVLGIFAIALLAAFTLGASTATPTRPAPNPLQDHFISLEQAAKMIANFRNSPTAPTIKGGSFNRSIFDAILNQSGCSGIRIYYAKKDDGSATLVLVGLDSGGNDLVSGVLGEDFYPCPPVCGAPNDLSK